jgi:hypothetical protein
MPSRPFGRRLRVLAVLGVFALLTLPNGCSDNPADPNDPDDGPPDLHTDGGDVGLVIDTRPIFRKGYVATTATVTFPDYAEFDADLEIDPVTNLAILAVSADSLTQGQVTAFAAGIALHVTITGADGSQLATYDDAETVLDNSNTPLVISTDLPYVPHPVALESDMPYLLQRAGDAGVVAGWVPNYRGPDVFGVLFFWPDSSYLSGEPSQQFFFTPVNDSTYMVASVSADGQLVPWGLQGWTLLADTVGQLPRAEFVLRQDEDGWVEFKDSHEDRFLSWESYPSAIDPSRGVLAFTSGAHDRFRLISDDIHWSVSDRGTTFNQPIMTPALLDFAYSGTLTNCSGATLEETIGQSEQRTRTTAVGTTESFQLFESQALNLNVEIGFSVTAKIGVEIPGVGSAGEQVTVSEKLGVSEAFTTSTTQTSEQTWSSTTSTTIEVSRQRTLTLPPYTAVEAYDAVKTIENVRIPFTQVLRISGTRKDGGRALSGQEIRSQMLLNLVGGVIQTVGANYVDIGVRGYAVIDKLFKATTNVTEIPGACD